MLAGTALLLWADPRKRLPLPLKTFRYHLHNISFRITPQTLAVVMIRMRSADPPEGGGLLRSFLLLPDFLKKSF